MSESDHRCSNSNSSSGRKAGCIAEIKHNHCLKPSPSGKRSRDASETSGGDTKRKKAVPVDMDAMVASLSLKQLVDCGEGVNCVPLVCKSTSRHCDSICLEPNRPYTIGRSTRFSQFVFDDPRVSKENCQILFDVSCLRVYLLHGVCTFPGSNFSSSSSSSCLVHEFRNRLARSHTTDDMEDREKKEEMGVSTTCVAKFKHSLNGLFVNGVTVGKGLVVELSDGDEVLLVCGNKHRICKSRTRIGFVVQKIVFREAVGPGCDDNTEIIKRQECWPSCSSGKVKKRIFALKRNESKVVRSKRDDIVGKADAFLTLCRNVLQSDDPVSYIRRYVDPRCQVGETYACNPSSELLGLEPGNILKVPPNGEAQMLAYKEQPIQHDTSQMNQNIGCVRGANLESKSSTPATEGMVLKAKDDLLSTEEFSPVPLKSAAEDFSPTVLQLNSTGQKSFSYFDDVRPNKRCRKTSIPPPGKSFYLNRLRSMDSNTTDQSTVVSLPELLYPVESISRIFIATFTSDIPWFLSYCEIPHNLPVTVACHNTERCWSGSPDNRSSAPYPNFPNLVVVYPPFSEAIAFGKDRKRQGIACHHPKLFVLQRENSIRVIITSANLVDNQWNNVTNTVWWQDFPRISSPDYLSLFNKIGRIMNKGSGSDFSAHLAGFMASLVIDVPSQAHWIVELTKYDFGGAAGFLIASVPGVHSYRVSCSTEPTQFFKDVHDQSCSSGIKLGSVEASVVGLGHLFRTADKNGARLKKLAALLGNSCEKAYGMLEVVLRRNKNVPADANAVSIFVADPKDSSERGHVQLGFLPRNVAKWVSPLWDIGIFMFSGLVYPQEALASALGGNGMKVQLILQVLQGPKFKEISKVMQPEHVSAFCSLIASIQRCTGLWRLEQVLNQYKWPEHLESDFIYGASSIGSICTKFLASFSSASGKRSLQSFDSDESDPEWGCWNACKELQSPSIRILFPTIERVKSAHHGILPSKRILCFSEKTWERLKMLDILRDAVPRPCNRVGHPMHVKVARRRFQSQMTTSSFGWVYCGSHNFSAAAWGRTISSSSSNQVNGTDRNKSTSDLRLHVCNYELGIVFIFPPCEMNSVEKNSVGLDDVALPFLVPAPKYGTLDRPATKQAMRMAFADVTELGGITWEAEVDAADEQMEETPDEEEEAVEAPAVVAKEKEEENAYAQALWCQVDSNSG